MQKVLYLTDHFSSALGKNYPRSLRFQAPARPSELFAHARDFSRAPSLMKPWGFGNLFPAPSFLPHILLILLHTLSCSCLRLCFRKVAQVSLSAVELPDHLFVPALPASCLVFFFATKKKTRRPCDCFVIPRSHFGKPRPPRPKKKPPVRDKTSHHQRIDAAGQGTRPSAQSKH